MNNKIDFPIPEEKAVIRKCDNCLFHYELLRYNLLFGCSLYPKITESIKHYKRNKNTGCFMFTTMDEVILKKVGEFHEKDS